MPVTSKLKADYWEDVTRVFNFEKLEVWHKALDFAELNYRVTSGFPTEERFGLTNQIRRAGASVPSNIAEGSSRTSRSDFGRFIEIATGSVFEVVSHVSVAKRLDFISDADFRRVYTAAEEQSRMLSGLRTSLRANTKP